MVVGNRFRRIPAIWGRARKVPPTAAPLQDIRGTKIRTIKVRPRVRDTAEVERVVIHTSHHTHHVIGSGSGDPQKYDPAASRETLDHSLPYIFAVALQDGTWDHELSYAPERAHRSDTVELDESSTTRMVRLK